MLLILWIEKGLYLLKRDSAILLVGNSSIVHSGLEIATNMFSPKTLVLIGRKLAVVEYIKLASIMGFIVSMRGYCLYANIIIIILLLLIILIIMMILDHIYIFFLQILQPRRKINNKSLLT